MNFAERKEPVAEQPEFRAIFVMLDYDLFSSGSVNAISCRLPSESY